MPKKTKKESKTIPTDMITEEMRAAGIDETTPMVTREEAVEKLGEEVVAEAEKDALDMNPTTYLGHEIHGEVSDHTHDGRAYKKFSTANGQAWMVTPEDFEKGLS